MYARFYISGVLNATWMKARLERLRKYTPQTRINYPAQPGVASTNEGKIRRIAF